MVPVSLSSGAKNEAHGQETYQYDPLQFVGFLLINFQTFMVLLTRLQIEFQVVPFIWVNIMYANGGFLTWGYP